MIAMAAIPPTTPPTIAPVLELFAVSASGLSITVGMLVS